MYVDPWLNFEAFLTESVASLKIVYQNPIFQTQYTDEVYRGFTRAPEGPKGIDVNEQQPNINWASVKANGVEFAYIEATTGLCAPILDSTLRHFSLKLLHMNKHRCQQEPLL